MPSYNIPLSTEMLKGESLSGDAILMCSPDYFTVAYDINPYMDSKNAFVDIDLAKLQWNNLRRTLEECGVAVHVMKQPKGWPDQVFTANAGTIINGTIWLSDFRNDERKGEKPFFADWFKKNGYELRSVNDQLPSGHNYIAFEGAGDCHIVGETLFGGYGVRTDLLAYEIIKQQHPDVDLIALELTSPYHYHLDTCFVPLSRDVGVWVPEAFTAEARQVLREEVDRLIEIPSGERRSLACNCVVVGDDVILADGNKLTSELIEDAGFVPHLVNVSEFIKAGGGCRCLTIVL